MTRPHGTVLERGTGNLRHSALVLDGDTVKLRLIAERAEAKTPVHVDWLRFTVLRHNIPSLGLGDLLPTFTDATAYELWREFDKHLRQVPDCDAAAGGQALDLARLVAENMGPDFVVHPEPRKGHDFYRHRVSIERNGVECGWVGFQASSDSPRQQAMARTLHVNLYGAACTFAATGWNQRLAEVVEGYKATITRVDLALDFFDGFDGGMRRVLAEYEAGLMNVNGKRPKCKQLGDWTQFSEGERSFYFGSKEAGKQTNVYEKGDQLYGVGVSKWTRIEARMGNKLRVLDADMLRRPADYFAGLSEWHAAMLREADAMQVVPEPTPTTARLPLETVRAEVSRSVRWLLNTAAPSLAEAFRHGADEVLAAVMGSTKRPGRLGRFRAAEVAPHFAELQHFVTTAERAGPAFAS